MMKVIETILARLDAKMNFTFHAVENGVKHTILLFASSTLTTQWEMFSNIFIARRPWYFFFFGPWLCTDHLTTEFAFSGAHHFIHRFTCMIIYFLSFFQFDVSCLVFFKTDSIGWTIQNSPYDRVYFSSSPFFHPPILHCFLLAPFPI